MSAPETTTQLVARFLRSNHYNETLEAFIHEAGLPEDAGSLVPGAWTIEQILQEKIQFDTSVNFEKTGSSERQGWTTPAPDVAQAPQVATNSNVLCVSGDTESNKISVTTADRTWKRFSAYRPYKEDATITKVGDSPILSTVYVPGGFVLTTSMSGHLALRRAVTYDLLDQCRHHSKYAVQVVSYQNGNDWFVATAGWDQKVYVYSPSLTRLRSYQASEEAGGTTSLPGCLGQPIHAIAYTSNPESVVFARHPDTGAIFLITSRRDSTHLHYYLIVQDSTHVSIEEAGRQNLAPHSNAWVAFTPCSLTLCPSDHTLLAVATSHIPHMKIIIVRLLFPSTTANLLPGSSEHRTQASMARAELALQDREDAAINVQVSTMAPQTTYSTPQVVWRPDGSGVFVNGDDGVIRGIEATTGKIISTLKGHEAGSKVRTLWAGCLTLSEDGGRQEILVSGGFDKRLILWTVS